MTMNRRDWLTLAGTSAAAAGLAPAAAHSREAQADPFTYCLNTSTLRGHKLTLEQEIDLAAEAGYQGIEPWIDELARHRESGGSLKDVAKRLADRGLKAEGAIGFARWIVDEPAERAKALEQLKGEMAMVREAGGVRMAAPPAGATEGGKVDLLAAAERYRAILELGEREGVTPVLEVWGFSANLSRLGESMCVAVESGHPRACLLPDVYHLYKGGSPFEGLGLLAGRAIGLFHVNDYPDIPRGKVTDADRVFPGDGVAPMGRVLGLLKGTGYRGALSLELFNPDYWRRPPAEVAAEGLRKMKAAAAAG